jgi:acyl-CoA reductase-like NAD-dependent aldehyde dehydrogenase
MAEQLERRGERTPARFGGLDYAPAPEATDHVTLRADHGLLIGGRWVEPASGQRFKTINPATEEVLAEVAEAGEEDVDAAVRAARSAYTKVWSKLSGAERAKYLYRIARVLQERAREFAVLETMNGGKPIKESRDVDLPLAAAHFFYHAGWVDKVAFTGSTEVGKAIQRTLAGTGTKLTLELGGKAANIVFEDAPLDQAVEGIINGIYFNQGHVCCAGSRLLVQESIAEPLVDKLKRRMATLRVGDPLDKNTDIGAINSRAQLDKITELVASGEADGAEAWQAPCELPTRGFWFRPTVFTAVAQSYRIAQEEIFGPVLSVLTFRTPDEAVEKANNTPYGLSAGVWTDKGSRILDLANRMRAGVVWANTFNRFDPTSPFGGYKESGFGREGGRHGLAAYLDLS